MRIVPVLMIAVLCVAVTACGGGGGNDPVQAGMPLVPALSGTAWSDGASQDLVTFPDTGVWVGDNINDATMHGFYRFDLSSIPAGATIEQAQFVVGQETGIGSPYNWLGVVHLDHVALGPTFTPADFNSGVLTLNVATLSANGVIQAKSALVTSQVIADLNAVRTTLDLRLRFTTPTANPVNTEYAKFNSHTNLNGAGNGIVPTLTVTYREP